MTLIPRIPLLVPTLLIAALTTLPAEADAREGVRRSSTVRVERSTFRQPIDEPERRWNISTNPAGIILGSYGGSLSYGFSDAVALRLDLNYFDPIGTDIRGFEVGASAPVYFRGLYDGPYLEPGIAFRAIDDPGGDVGGTAVGPQLLLGWSWLFDNGVNVAVAGGVGRNFGAGNEPGLELSDEIFANGYLRLGYAF